MANQVEDREEEGERRQTEDLPGAAFLTALGPNKRGRLDCPNRNLGDWNASSQSLPIILEIAGDERDYFSRQIWLNPHPRSAASHILGGN